MKRLRWVSLHFFPGRCDRRPYVDRGVGLEVGWLWFTIDIGYYRKGER